MRPRMLRGSKFYWTVTFSLLTPSMYTEDILSLQESPEIPLFLIKTLRPTDPKRCFHGGPYVVVERDFAQFPSQPPSAKFELHVEQCLLLKRGAPETILLLIICSPPNGGRWSSSERTVNLISANRYVENKHCVVILLAAGHHSSCVGGNQKCNRFSDIHKVLDWKTFQSEVWQIFIKEISFHSHPNHTLPQKSVTAHERVGGTIQTVPRRLSQQSPRYNLMKFPQILKLIGFSGINVNLLAGGSQWTHAFTDPMTG